MFRFTLGIPGFDDDLIPRVVGILGLLLLSANHLAAGSAAGSASLVRTGIIPDFMQQLQLLLETVARENFGQLRSRSFLHLGAVSCNSLLASDTHKLLIGWPIMRAVKAHRVQGRAEGLGVAIAAVCIAIPTVQQRLKEMQPGAIRGVTKAAPSFLLSPDLTDDQRKVQFVRIACPRHACCSNSTTLWCLTASPDSSDHQLCASHRHSRSMRFGSVRRRAALTLVG